MKATVSFFPSGNIIASLPDGKIIIGHDFEDAGKKLWEAGVTKIEATKNLQNISLENVEYNDEDGKNLFTDRGNRVTFDRVRVTDDEIRLALVHAKNKFGDTLVLTGDDVNFTARMARIAGEIGVVVSQK